MTQPLVGKQILIVEDEPVFRSLLDSWFSSLGATTALAGDGLDALELLGSFTPDLMICDLAMPRMNGLKLVEHLRNRGDQTPFWLSRRQKIWQISPKRCDWALRTSC